jgi:hypothetical protein
MRSSYLAFLVFSVLAADLAATPTFAQQSKWPKKTLVVEVSGQLLIMRCGKQEPRMDDWPSARLLSAALQSVTRSSDRTRALGRRPFALSVLVARYFGPTPAAFVLCVAIIAGNGAATPQLGRACEDQRQFGGGPSEPDPVCERSCTRWARGQSDFQVSYDACIAKCKSDFPCAFLQQSK